MKTAFIFVLFLVLSSMLVHAQEVLPIRTSNEIEASCRIKAKEVAAETYRGCVTDQKNTQIEQIKKEYAAKLQSLKAHYEKELKKMSSKEKVEESSDSSAAPAEKSEKSEKSEKIDSAAAKSPVKKSKSASAVAIKKPVKESKKSTAVAKSSVPSEMTVQLKQAPATPMMDESTMDLPEPIPVEDVPYGESSI